jgi:hypothetical protein
MENISNFVAARLAPSRLFAVVAVCLPVAFRFPVGKCSPEGQESY